MSDIALNPYVGPVPFGRDDEHFYGREGDLRRLAILFIAQRIVLLYSPSGAGKTSLVQARLIPALEEEGFKVLPVIRVNQRPEDGSTETNTFVYSTINSLEENGDNGETVGTFSDYWDRKRQELGDKAAVLFFDQFEEVITLDPHDQQGKVDFFDQVGAVLQRDDNLWAMFAIREDYLAELDPYRHLIPGKLNHPYRLELLNKDQALDAVQKPAADVDVIFEDEAAEKLVSQLRRVTVRHRDGRITFEEGPFVEPVQLQVVCQTLWQDLEPEAGGTIGEDDVAAEGHVDEALGEFYDKTVARVALEKGVDERDIRDWFERDLITEGGLRGQVMGSENLQLSQDVIDALVDAHLIRAEERRSIQWYELAHDRLVKPVKESNNTWYDENLSLLQLRAAVWNKKQDDGSLLVGEELEEAEAWAENSTLKNHEEAFLDRSREVEDKRKAKERRNRLILIGGTVGIVVLLAIAFGMFLLWRNADDARKEADAERNRANEQKNLALQAELQAQADAVRARTSESLAETDKRVAEFLEGQAILAQDEAEKAVDLASTRETEAVAARDEVEALLVSILAGRLVDASRAMLDEDQELALLLATAGLGISAQPDTLAHVFNDASFKPFRRSLDGHEGGVASANFSPDEAPGGVRIVTAGCDERDKQNSCIVGSAKVWDLEGNELASLDGHTGQVNSAVISPDGALGEARIVTASSDDSARVWDLEGNELASLDGHQGRVKSAVFSPDGRYIVTVSGDSAKLWDAEGNELAPLDRNVNYVESAVFSPDGQNIVTANYYDASVWDLEGNKLVSLDGHRAPVWSAAFSPDGQQIVTTSLNSAKVWDLEGNELTSLDSHQGWVNSAVFSPDGRQIVTAGEDGSARVWDLEGNELASLKGHKGMVLSAIFSPDGAPGGRQIITAGSDGSTKVWDLEGNELASLDGHQGRVLSAVFSPDGRNIVTAGYDSAKLWDPEGNELASLVGHTDWVYTAVVSPDGRNIVTASEDGTARVWDLEGNELATLDVHEWGVNMATFSPDGRTIVTADDREGATLWDLEGNELAFLAWHTRNVLSAVFSPDGQTIVTTDDRDGAKLWDLENNELASLDGHTDRVNSAAFSPDGAPGGVRIVTASEDGSVRLWDLEGNELASLGGHDCDEDGYCGVNSAVFSPDGRTIVTAGDDGSARLWDLEGNELASLDGHTAPVNSAVFSPDGAPGGMQIVTASEDWSARLWDLEGNELASLGGHLAPVNSAVFSPDGGKIVTASDDGSAKVWDIYPTMSEKVEIARQRLGEEGEAFTEKQCLRFFPRDDQESCPRTLAQLYALFEDDLEQP